MLTELNYLLDELDNWDNNKPITVQDLKKMISKAFDKISKDQEIINNIDMQHL